MGAEQFWCEGKGRSLKEAFQSAVKDAQYDHGHSGYTGTIAEKDSVNPITPPAGVTPEEFWKAVQRGHGDGVDAAVDAAWEKVDDKWGPAGAIDLGEDDPEEKGQRRFGFFGWASS